MQNRRAAGGKGMNINLANDEEEGFSVESGVSWEGGGGFGFNFWIS